MKLSTLILDLLRTYSKRGASVATLLEAGKLFNFNENMIRVCLSRLVTTGKVENFKRGSYRLAEEIDPLNNFIEEWRLGENRRTHWDTESWLFVYPGPSANDKNQWALSCLGFRNATNDDLWLRPSNLRKPIEDIQTLLHQIGLGHQYTVIRGASASGEAEKEWLAAIDIDELESNYHIMNKKLEASLQQLQVLERHHAMKESFHLGGEAINMLATDLLLPEEIQSPIERSRLWETMIAYDKAGKEVWTGQHPVPPMIPRPQSMVIGLDD